MFLLAVSSAHGSKAPPPRIADDEKRLVNFLFKNYSAVIRPVRDKKKPVRVSLEIALAQLIDLVRFCVPELKVRSL